MSRLEFNAGSKLFSLGDLAGLFNGYLVLTDEMVIAHISGPFAGSLGYGANDLVGVSAEEIFDEPTLFWLRSRLAESLKTAQTGRNKLTMFDRSRQPMSKPVAILRIWDKDQGYFILLDEESASFATSPDKRPKSSKRIRSNTDLRSLSAIEGIHIRKVLSATGGNRTKASEILGISRVTLLSKIKQFGLRSEV